MIKLRIVTFLLVALVASSCGSAPKAATDSVVSTIENERNCQQHLEDSYWGGECREFKAANVVKKTLTDADKANGIDGSWCMQIDYIWKSDNGGEWKQVTRFFYVTQSDDEFKALESAFSLDIDDCLTQ